MSLHKENQFESEIVEHLTSHGWLLGKSADYDRKLALYPSDVESWLSQTQPLQWAKVKRDEALQRLAQTMDKTGSLEVLRHGFKHLNANFQMCQFAPDTSKNQETVQRHQKVICRVVRQLRYSLHNGNSIDLVFFVNGIPLATAEIKTDFTQTVGDAIAQYQSDRLPRDPQTKAEEPLLSFKKRALVHFAVSNAQVWMATHLQGQQTRFLPFNRGDNGGKGNPPNSHGHQTSYLWERVLERSSWLDILGRFLHLEHKEEEKDGKKIVKESLIFPRYHQWEAVQKIIAAARTEGAGQTYLIQHSAGSGKSNSIAWIAHRLSSLHDQNEKPVFHGVIVVTDRNVLDSQLQETIYQFEHKQGVVVPIVDGPSKTQQLIKALLDDTPIIVLTLQTFPFFLEYIESLAGKTEDELEKFFDEKSGFQKLTQSDVTKLANLSHSRFAIVADEAHSSQTGDTANKVSEALGAASGSGGKTQSVEEVMLEKMRVRATHPNISFFAFTATPKAATLQRFGRVPNPDLPPSDSNLPAAFHVYSMRQAIEEEFILDVLKNYVSYKQAFKLAHNGQDYDSEKPEEVDEAEAIKTLFRWVRLHPTNISQKVAVIVEHFRLNVAPLLGGKAKAMVVTAGRKDAVRYKLAMDKYILQEGYELGTLVAFSGEVEDPESGPHAFNENNLNPDLRGRALRTALGEDEFQLLIVANKFQTGFDQPLLCAMYVDKQLSGVTAVQTLSRLNRIYPNKNRTYVLDFVNDPDEILASFRPYYETAELAGVSDPNQIHDLQFKLDEELIYTPSEVEAFAQTFFTKGSKQKDLIAWITPAVQRFQTRWKGAVATLENAGASQGEQNKATIERDALLLFRKDLGTFVRMYDFLSQILDYEDTGLESRAIFFRHLLPLLRVTRSQSEIDLSLVDLTHFKLERLGENNLALAGNAGNDETSALSPLAAAGSAQLREADRASLVRIIETINELFEGDFTRAELENFVCFVRDKLRENDELKDQAQNNTRENFENGSFGEALTRAIYAGLQSYQGMAEQIFSNDEKKDAFKKGMRDVVYEDLQKHSPPSQAM